MDTCTLGHGSDPNPSKLGGQGGVLQEPGAEGGWRARQRCAWGQGLGWGKGYGQEPANKGMSRREEAGLAQPRVLQGLTEAAVGTWGFDLPCRGHPKSGWLASYLGGTLTLASMWPEPGELLRVTSPHESSWHGACTQEPCMKWGGWRIPLCASAWLEGAPWHQWMWRGWGDGRTF